MSTQMSRLDWPPQFDRTAPEDRSRNNKYDVTLARAFADLETELERIGVDDYDYEFDAQQRKRDKRPYARANPDDPGFVLRWSMDGHPYAVACDRYTKLRDNVRTVGLYLHEKRKMEGRPVETGESEFANARLPPGEAMPPGGVCRPHHEVLGVDPDASEREIRSAYREKLKDAHPDQGGSEREFKAVKEAKKELLGD